jgi:hypothetical protein
MADGVPITPGSGVTISTEELTNLNGAGNTNQLQRVGLTQILSDGVAVDVKPAAPLHTTRCGATTATLSNQNDQATNVTLKAANTARRAIIIYNDSTARLYVKYGSTASATSFSYILEAGESYREEIYTGQIDGIWAADSSGAARITEITA